MAQNTSWLSRLARHASARRTALEAERKRQLWASEGEKVALAAGEEADREAQELLKKLNREIEEGKKRLEEARNYSAHLANRFTFEVTRAEAWKAAAGAWSEAALDTVKTGRGPGYAFAQRALGLEEKAERAERLQAQKSEVPADDLVLVTNSRLGGVPVKR